MKFKILRAVGGCRPHSVERLEYFGEAAFHSFFLFVLQGLGIACATLLHIAIVPYCAGFVLHQMKDLKDTMKDLKDTNESGHEKIRDKVEDVRSDVAYLKGKLDRICAFLDKGVD